MSNKQLILKTMKKVFGLCILALMAIEINTSCASNEKNGAQKGTSNELVPLIIFDTDMGPDYDDIGAIAMLHALADSGECEILATVASDAHPSIAPTIEVFNRY